MPLRHALEYGIFRRGDMHAGPIMSTFESAAVEQWFRDSWVPPSRRSEYVVLRRRVSDWFADPADALHTGVSD